MILTTSETWLIRLGASTVCDLTPTGSVWVRSQTVLVRSSHWDWDSILHRHPRLMQGSTRLNTYCRHNMQILLDLSCGGINHNIIWYLITVIWNLIFHLYYSQAINKYKNPKQLWHVIESWPHSVRRKHIYD